MLPPDKLIDYIRAAEVEEGVLDNQTNSEGSGRAKDQRKTMKVVT